MDPTLKSIYDYANKKYYNTIIRATEPLKQLLNIPYFAYQKVEADGNYSVICNNPEFSEFYLENAFYKYDPYLVAPSKYSSGSSIHVVSSEVHELDEGLTKICSGSFKKFNFGEAIIFVVRQLDYYEIFVFSLPSTGNSALQTCTKQLDLLERFITHFKKTNHRMLCDLSEVQANIAQIRGEDFEKVRPNYFLLNQDLRNTFLETISPEEHMLQMRVKQLTNRESECLYWMIKGKTAAETGDILGISRRTVESYREKSRDKLGPHYTLSNLCYLIGKYNLL